MNLIKIEITNWKKYNPRHDRKNYSWFRFQNDFFHDQYVFDLTDNQKLLWIFILCEASKNNGELTLNVNYTSTFLKRSQKQILNDLESLQDLVSWSRHEAVMKPASGRPTVRTNDTVQYVTNDTSMSTEADSGSHILSYLWNKHRRNLSKVRTPLRPARFKTCRARWKEAEQRGVDPESYWVEVIQKLAASDFCNGKNDNSWVATFDFLLKPETQDKALEGKYDNRTSSEMKQSTAQRRSHNNATLLAKLKAENEG